MALEPPPKRRRKGQSPLDQESDGENGDELFFQPFEVEAQRDPGYRLSIERAYADQRFQATMAHIFDKYGRDFEGIGDEIDLVTGEIVVNNGHIRNMRNEADVGYDLDEGEEDEDEDEDEGILLEDLVDEDEEEDEGEGDGSEEEEEGTENEHRQDQGEDATDDEEEDRIMQGREPSQKSTALVPISGSRTPSTMMRTHQPGLFPDRYGSSALGFGPSPLAYSTPFAVSSSPLPGGVWDLPGQFSDPLWDHPDFAIARRAPTRRLPLTADRYNFPAKDGQSSIWAPRSRYKEAEDEPLRSVFSAAFGKHLARKRMKARKSLPPSEPTEPINDDEDDEEAILTGKASGARKSHESTVIGATEEEDDDMVLSGSSLKPTNAEHEETEKDANEDAPSAAQSAKRGRKRKRKVTEDATMTDTQTSELGSVEETSGSQLESQPQQPEVTHLDAEWTRSTEEDSQGPSDRRRSGRVRKQVEFLNKISWAEALAERRSQKMTVVLPSVDPQSRGDYKRVDSDINLENQSTSLAVEPSVAETKQDNTHTPPEEDTTVDSQNNSLDEKASEQDVADHDQVPRLEIIVHKDTDSACILSDDEAPTFLSKPRNRRAEKSHHSEVESPPAVEALTRSVMKPSVDCGAINDEVAREDGHQQEAEDPSLLQQTATAEAEVPVLSADDTITDSTVDTIDPPAKSSPLRKSSNENGAATEKLIVPELNIELDDNICLPSDDSIGAPPMSSSPTRALTRFTAEVSLDEKPQRLSREVRWLRTKAAAILSSSPSASHSPGSPEPNRGKRTRGRPRKSAAPVEQPSTTEVSQDEQPANTSVGPPVLEDSTYETAEEPQVDTTLSSPRRTASPTRVEKQTPAHSPSKPTTLQKPTSTPFLSLKNPQTPRHAKRYSTTKAPSSRRSILSLLSDNDDDEEMDELGRNLAAMPKLLSSGAHTTAARRIWKSSARTTEVYHTPIKKRPTEPISPGSIVKTPGGTVRACGLNGYRCGRDFCFTCL